MSKAVEAAACRFPPSGSGFLIRPLRPHGGQDTRAPFAPPSRATLPPRIIRLIRFIRGCLPRAHAPALQKRRRRRQPLGNNPRFQILPEPTNRARKSLQHLDIVDGKGRLLEKKWLLGMGLAEALLFAVEDFKNGYGAYIKDFRA
jgi:hypothetical protein